MTVVSLIIIITFSNCGSKSENYTIRDKVTSCQAGDINLQRDTTLDRPVWDCWAQSLSQKNPAHSHYLSRRSIKTL